MSVLPGTQYQAGQGISTTNNTSLHNNLANSLPTSVNSVGGMGAQGVVTNNVSESQVLDKKRLTELVKEVDPAEQLDDDVEDVLLQIADDFIEQTVSQACALAKHRKAGTIDVRDVQIVLERSWNMWIPGFGTEDIRPYKRSATTEAHKQRMAVIRKALKKY
eukprot:TRINITY_DN42040_c0_g1_i1.p1 TRINITY_DN42040_c0_g1~~TRINITY_DN42040_c0_g1_i1.p1  ORF type:complete len:162 (+),score=64.81 TRINITY_DN42040_c0_g1_i1:41-526(+)